MHRWEVIVFERKNTEYFVARARELHGDKYDYSLVNYTGCRKPVIIICPLHGNFSQDAFRHLRTVGCNKCGMEEKIRKFRLTTESYIKKATGVHGDKYDYSLVKYHHSLEPVNIICRLSGHGVFSQVASDHLRGHGCPKCSADKTGNRLRLTNEEFITRARKLHGDKYDYSKIDYKWQRTKLTIVCPLHGEFQQMALAHLSGHGCKKCSDSFGEREITKIVEGLNLTYTREMTFPDCCYKRPLSFDFFIEFNNDISCVIEFQGDHHYRPIKRGSSMTDLEAQNTFEIIKIRDEIKRRWCEEHKTPLLIIPYWEFKNIKSVITKFIKEIS